MIENYPNIIVLEGTVIHSTDSAVLFDFGHTEEVWIPKSQMEDWPDDGFTGEVMVYEWIAHEKGLI